MYHRYRQVQKSNRSCARKSERGFALLEILLAIAVSTLLFAPVLNIVFSVARGGELFDFEVVFGGELQSKSLQLPSKNHMTLGELKTCKAFSDTLIGKLPAHTSDLDLRTYVNIASISAGDLQLGTTSLATSMKLLGGNLVLALNSATGTDPDLVVYNTSELTDSGSINLSVLSAHEIARLNTGPGAVDMAFLGNSVFLANTSVESDVQKISLDLSGMPKLTQTKSCIAKVVRNDSRHIQSLASFGDKIVLGFEKNEGSEIFVMNPDTCAILDQIETGYGITELKVINDILYVLGPADPEMHGFVAENNKLKLVREYDATGLSGNARSLDMLGSLLAFGRSRGNEELDFVSFNDRERVGSAQSTGESVITGFSLYTSKLGASIDALVADPRTVALISSDTGKEFQIFENKSGVLKRKGYLDLPARAKDMVCIGDQLLVATLGTSTALISLTVR